MNERDKAINDLINNARKASEEHEKDISDLKPVNKNLPGYIPYIGKEYFSDKIQGKRILIYALSQNIKPNSDFAKPWENWDVGLNRQNLAYYGKYEKEGKIGIEMHPFDTGHLPVIAAMLLDLLGIQTNKLGGICDFVSATNLSKFSFRKNQNRDTTDKKESLEKCFDWFSNCEIKVLEPDYIMCAGKSVYNTLKEKYFLINQNIKIIKIIFPRLPQVVTKKLKNQDRINTKELLNLFSQNDRDKKVDYKKYNRNLEYVIERDRIYFSNMYSEIEKQLKFPSP